MWKNILKADPKKGTGKKPKGSARRLYTDENPKDTVPVKFKTAKDVRETFSSSAFKNKSHKRQSQIINLVEQRARVAAKRAKDPNAKKRLNAAHKVSLARKSQVRENTGDENMTWEKIIKRNCGCGKDPCETYGEVK